MRLTAIALLMTALIGLAGCENRISAETSGTPFPSSIEVDISSSSEAELVQPTTSEESSSQVASSEPSSQAASSQPTEQVSSQPLVQPPASSSQSPPSQSSSSAASSAPSKTPQKDEVVDALAELQKVLNGLNQSLDRAERGDSLTDNDLTTFEKM